MDFKKRPPRGLEPLAGIAQDTENKALTDNTGGAFSACLSTPAPQNPADAAIQQWQNLTDEEREKVLEVMELLKK